MVVPVPLARGIVVASVWLANGCATRSPVGEKDRSRFGEAPRYNGPRLIPGGLRATLPKVRRPRPTDERLPRLDNGDHLDQKTFHARYEAMLLC